MERMETSGRAQAGIIQAATAWWEAEDRSTEEAQETAVRTEVPCSCPHCFSFDF